MSDEINEITEGHSDYKPADARDENVKHQLTGMYQNWFLDYASYVILERAVPHINDGLKPVQRRILHSMKRLDDGRYNKVANIVGHTMQFHPHGDASIGDALVQLGQKDLLIYRGTPFQVCAGHRIQSKDDRMEAVLRRQKQGTGHPPREVPAIAGTGSGRYRRRTFIQDITSQLQ